MKNEELASYFTGTTNMLNSLADKVDAIRLALVATIPEFESAYRDAVVAQGQHSAVASPSKSPSSQEQALDVARLIADLRSRKV
jgi:hypothetical protein